MKEYFSYLIISLFLVGVHAQEVSFTEYDLDNGLHVILHQDNTAPLVTTSVLYHVGAKDELADRTGFAHFFEHLLFEGTKNIERGEWFSIVSSNGGKNNAYTNDDYTYYYEVFPSNNLELGLWLESERMLHPVINKIGVESIKFKAGRPKNMALSSVKLESKLNFMSSSFVYSIELMKAQYDKNSERLN